MQLIADLTEPIHQLGPDIRHFLFQPGDQILFVHFPWIRNEISCIRSFEYPGEIDEWVRAGDRSIPISELVPE